MKDSRMFFAFWLINALVFYFAPAALNGLVVTGNARLAPFMASIVSSFLLTVAVTLTAPAFEAVKVKLKDELQWAFAYLFVNVLTVWLIARYADLTGVGIGSAWVAVLLGTVLNILQWVTWKYALDKKEKRR